MSIPALHSPAAESVVRCDACGLLAPLSKCLVDAADTVFCPACAARYELPPPHPAESSAAAADTQARINDLEAQVRELCAKRGADQDREDLLRAQIEAQRSQAEVARARWRQSGELLHECRQLLRDCSASRVTLAEEMRRAQHEAAHYQSALERIEGGDWSAEYCRQIAREALGDGDGD